jgi:uncharacterized protein (TIGR00661 family)
MARIAIGVCGEGRGHAARALTLIERFGGRHELLVASTDEALALLAARTGACRAAVRFLDVPGIRFEYAGGRIDVSRSIAAGLWYGWRRLPAILGRVTRALEAFGADLVITDFEPVLPRAARRLGVPIVSVDHQHFLLAYDLRHLPHGLRWQAACMGLAVRLYVRGAADTVVSAFFRPPLVRGWEQVVQVGPLLRGAVLAAEPHEGGHVVSYLRRHTPAAVLDALAACGLPVRVYGLGGRAPRGAVTFHEIDETRFVEDLAGCAAVVAAGGNQLIGEALHLGKPLLARPEAGHAEQCMNGHFLRAMGCGDFVPLEQVDADRVRAFLAARDRYRPALAAVAGRMDGTNDVMRVVERRLPAVPGQAARGVAA